jgi:hypothetical protein
MNKAIFKADLTKGVFAIVALCLLPLLLQATPPSTHLIRNNLVNLKASKLIDTIGKELEEKTGYHAYVIATNEHFPEKFNLVAYSKQYEAKLNKPYVLFIFAPYATIMADMKERGRIGIIPSSEKIKKLYDYDRVRDAAIKVVALKDSNTEESKFNVGIVQAYSELADEIAQSQDVKLIHIIPNDMGVMLTILRILVYTGTVLVLWIFIFRPLWMKIKHRKSNE